jgi:hypothetical protein
MGRIFRLQLAKFDKFMFARMERLPSAIYDMKWCSAITATAFNSIRPFLHRLGHFGIWRALVMLSEQ